MSEERRYYIENAITEDKWLIYDDAHRYGCTKKRPVIYTLYALYGENESQSLEPVIVRKDIDTNTYYDTTIAPPHEWVDNISTLGLYKKIGNITLYMGEQELPYVGYTSDINSNTADYIQNTNGGLTPVEDLYYSQGITDHKCNNYYISEGVVLVWYDPETHLYWDRQPGRYHWTGDPPRTDQQESNYIPVFTDPILPHPQWENDLSQLPEFYRSYGVFEPTHITVGLVTTFKDWDQWELESKSLMWTRDGRNHINYEPVVKYITFDESEQFPKESPNTPLYTDVLKTGIPIYVIDEDGVEDAGGVHRDYGHAFTGDYECVWIESDADVDLFQGTSRTVTGQSHDDENPVLYYISYQYYTPTEVHNFGYTFTKGEDIEIWDSNLIGKRLWEDTQWLYISPDRTSNRTLPSLDGTNKKASVLAHNSSSGDTYIEAKQAGEAGNNLSVTISWLDSWSGRAGYQVRVFDSGTLVYDSGERQSSITEDTINDYVVLSGSWPNVGFSGSSVTLKLSGGADEHTIGIPLYYEDGTRVTLNDYLKYRITNTLQMNSLTYGGSSANTINTSSLIVDANKFSFASDEHGNLLLVYTGTRIEGILGFSFNWDQTGIDIDGKWSVNPQYVYFTNQGRQEPGIDVATNTSYPLYYADGTQIQYNDFDGLELVRLANKIYLSSGIVEDSFGDQNYYRQFNNIGGYLYFMHNKGNSLTQMIGMSVAWQRSNNHYFYLQSNGSSKSFSANDYWWVLQSKEYLDSLGLIEGTDYIDTHWSGDYHYNLLPSLASRVQLVAAWDDAGANITSNLRVSTSRTISINDVSTNILTIDSTNATSEIMGYVLKVIPPSIDHYDLIVACKYDSSYSDSVRPVDFITTDSDGCWWAEVLTVLDKNILVSKNCFYEDTSWGFYGEVDYNPSYTYEILQFYSDLGNTPVDLDVSKFYIAECADVAAIFCREPTSTIVKSYKMRIHFSN